MGVSIYPAQGGDGFKLRKIITTTGLQDLGQARNCYVVVAGGGGGGSGCLSGSSWSGSGGGGAGAVGGSILLKEFHATIGAGGSAGGVDSNGGNGGTTYLTLYGSIPNQNVSDGTLSGWYIACVGGQGGSTSGTPNEYTGSFENAPNPTISGWGFFTKLFGNSGAGGGLLGNVNNTGSSAAMNYSSSLNTVEGLSLVGWTPNQLSMFNGQGSAATVVSHATYGGGWAGIEARPKEPALNNAAQNTTSSPLYTWTRSNTGGFQFSSAGAAASNGGPGKAGGSGYWTGGGGSGDTQGASQRGPQGGSSKAFRGGLGGAAGSGANGGAGGGAGIVANGGNGGDASGSTSGISGVGGLGGGGGAGGNRTGTQRAGGAGGAGAIAIYW